LTAHDAEVFAVSDPRDAARSRWWRSAALCSVLCLCAVTFVHGDRSFFRARRPSRNSFVARPVAANPNAAPAPLSLPPIPNPSIPPESITAPPLPVPSQLNGSEPTPALAPPVISEPAPTTPRPLPQQQSVGRAASDENIFVTVNEAFLNQLASRTNETAGPVHDCVLGAQVTGQQKTDSRVRIELLPSPTTAKFDVVVSGVTQSTTTAVTPQASVDSTAEQQFHVRKSIEFDGRQFLTRSPGAVLESRLQNREARTRASRVPVIGSIADSIALVEANRRRPMGEMESARRLTARLGPELNSSIDQRLAVANQALEKGRDPSTPWSGILNAPLKWSTVDHVIAGRGRFGSDPILSSAPPEDGLSGASLRLHESAVTEWLNSALPDEREFDVAELDAWLMRLGEKLGRPPRSESEAPTFQAPSGTMLVLAGERPLAVRFINQQFFIELTAAIRPPGVPELPMQKIVISYECLKEPEQISLRPLDVTVRAGDHAAADSVLSPALGAVIRGQAMSRMEALNLPRTLKIPTEGREVKLTAHSVRLVDGWLAIDWE
jgi:hypothetical protein